jgi:hypothetical protein
VAETGDEEGREGLEVEGEGGGDVPEEGEEGVVQGEGKDPAFGVMVVRAAGRREGGKGEGDEKREMRRRKEGGRGGGREGGIIQSYLSAGILALYKSTNRAE